MYASRKHLVYFTHGFRSLHSLFSNSPKYTLFAPPPQILHKLLFSNALGDTAYSQEHLKTMVYAKFGGQTKCIMGNSKIENGSELTYFWKLCQARRQQITHVRNWPECASRREIEVFNPHERAEKIQNKGNKFENRQCAGKIWREKAHALVHWARKFKSIVLYSNLRIEIPLNNYLDKFTN